MDELAQADQQLALPFRLLGDVKVDLFLGLHGGLQ
jgi:hypothetical protein